MTFVETYRVRSIKPADRARSTRPGTVLVGLVLTVVAPLTAALWALVKYWPISAGVWLAIAMVFWAVAASNAADEHDLALE